MGLPQNYVTVSRRPPDVEDYIDMFRRYRSWIIAPMFLGLVAATVVAFLWPDTYVSRAVMRVAPQQVSEKLIPATTNTPMSEKLSQMSEQILSRTYLESLIDKPSLDLYKKEKLQVPREEIVQEMRDKYIKIQPYVVAGAGNEKATSAFSISFSYPDRGKAQLVVRELVNMFVDSNQNVQRKSAQLTGAFLDSETKEAKARLDKLSGDLMKFTLLNQGKLPQQFQANVQMETSLEFRSGQLAADLAQANAQKSTLETALKGYDEQERFWANKTETTVNPAQTAVQNQKLAEVSTQLLRAQSTLAGMRKLYGEKWYQVKDLKGQIELLQSQKDELEKEQAKKDAEVVPAGPVKITDPQVQAMLIGIRNNIAQTKTSIQQAQLQIDRIVKAQVELSKQMANYQNRIEQAPLNEQQFASLNQELAMAKEDYEQMVKRREASQTAENLEAHQAGETLEVLDPASYPDKPTEPNRPLWAGMGTGLGLMLGIVLAGAKEMKNTSLKNLKDVRAYTNLPVLTSIPLLENALLVRRKRRLFWLAWSTSFIVGLMAMGGAVYYYYFGKSGAGV